MNKLWLIPLILLICIVVGWAGFLVKPIPFKQKPLEGREPLTFSLPNGLPKPVERFYTTYFGGPIPRIETVVYYGRGKIKPFGIWMPARFVFIHVAGRHYRHYIEATWFGLPFMKVNEGIIDGESFFEAPMGSFRNDPNTNQGANLAVWAEAGWFPSVWLSDSRVSWRDVDDHTALLFVPYGDERETFVVRFNPDTGFVDTMEAMRYREAGKAKKKILWITRNESMQPTRSGAPIAGGAGIATGSAMWLDQGSPWAYFTIESALYNAEVDGYLRARGK